MILYQLLRQRYSDDEIKNQFLNSVITSTAIEGVDVSYLSQDAKFGRTSRRQRKRE